MEIKTTNELIELLGLSKPVETIKVEKNSKGYNWEYKLVGNVEESIDNRVDMIEEKLKKRFEVKDD